MNNPEAAKYNSEGKIYVADLKNDRVQVFDKAGNFLTMWGQKGAGDGEFGNLHGIIVDHGTGWVYVADTANDRIQVFKPKSGLMN